MYAVTVTNSFEGAVHPSQTDEFGGSSESELVLQVLPSKPVKYPDKRGRFENLSVGALTSR